MTIVKRRIDVMVSSTTNDLGEHRRRVGAMITRQLYTPRIMDNDSTTGKDGVTYSLDLVDEAEVYILLLGFRYGYVPDDPRNPDKLSMTHMEYRRAKERAEQGDLYVLPFLTDDKLKPEVVRPELQAFRNEVLSDQIAFFSTIEELELKVLQALKSDPVQEFLNLLMDQADEPFQPRVGEILDNRYVFEGKLGQGGNGEVWKVQEHAPDGTIARTAAIKLLKRDISDKPQRIDRFKKEISIAYRLNHPHIIRTITWGEIGGQFYAVMDYVQGQTLRQFIAGRQFSEDQVVAYLGQVSQALMMAHKQKIVHRDVKPENILVYEGKLYLGDFGLAVSPDEDHSITATGELVGTKKYMAPEQWDNQPTTPQTDIYALGLIAYEMLTGQFPYDVSSHARLLIQHMNDPLPSHPALKAEIVTILLKATDKSSILRYNSVGDFINDLAHWQLDPANIDTKIKKYLHQLRDDIRGDVYEQLFVDLEGDIREILIPTPKAKSSSKYHDPYTDILGEFITELDADHHDPESTEAVYVENILDQLTHSKRVVLVGEPGAGKSFTLRRLVMRYVNQFDKLGRIPVFVPLNAFKGEVSFADYLKAQMNDDLKPYFDILIEQERLILICDALNEMPRESTDGRNLLSEVREQLEKTPLFVVSCRVRDYHNDLDDLNLERLEVRDMDLPAIQIFLQKYLRNQAEAFWERIGGSEGLIRFWQALHKNDEPEKFWQEDADIGWRLTLGGNHNAWKKMWQGTKLIPLARNPYLARVICTLHRRQQMPDNRAQLYSAFVDDLYQREYDHAEARGQSFPERPLLESYLTDIANLMQADTTTVLKTDNVPAQEALLQAALDATILTRDGDDLRFTHQLLQEYFAARTLLEQMTSNTDPRPLFGDSWANVTVWRETVNMLIDFSKDPQAVTRWVAQASLPLAIEIIETRSLKLDDLTRQTLLDVAKETHTATDVIRRANAYRVMGLLDVDKRQGIHVVVHDGIQLPDIDWVLIPNDGEWIYQDDKHEALPAFEISRYPITYVQFQTFIDDSEGYHSTKYDWFEGLASDADNRELREQYFKYSNHPRETVNWYQAMAFCRWLSHKMWSVGMASMPSAGYNPMNPATWAVRLPTEYEWEKAARGKDGREYPYEGKFDASKGNTNETGIRKTSAVGIFADGASPYGVLDMSGNVWEWCLTEYSNSNINIDGDYTNNSSRVLRGGSFANFYDLARAARRNDYVPDVRYFNFGFRVVRPPSL
jgi:serine/threonine protein kinase/formylglycine-generating enzyme required for sulfatase activity